MNDHLPIYKNVNISAPAAKVWAALTEPELMRQWLTEDPLTITTDWTVGSPFAIKGNLHGHLFENRGTVLAFEPLKHLSYSHLNSLSQLPDEPASYSKLDFRLSTVGHTTMLELTITGFSTDAIYHHLAFYWNTAIVLIKRFVENIV